MRALVLGLALVSVPAVAAEQQQFDLICTAKKASERYRIDLDRGEWCANKCDFVQKIASVTTGMLILAEHEPTFRGDSTSRNRINRASGQWEWYHSDPRYSSVMDHNGTCRPAPYSGMPAAKF